jgi:hypothetical protein
MSKSKAKPAAKAATEPSSAPKKGRKLKLILAAGLPLLLGGGGYAGWTVYASAARDGHAAEEAADKAHVAAIPPEIAAETSFTYSFALSELLRRMCGGGGVPALKAASEKEAAADGRLANLSWIAANRRLDTITEVSCTRMLVEIDTAERKAIAMAEPKKDEAKGGGGQH